MDRRERILDVARRCFIKHGFHAAGMAEISAACRMSPGNLYRYFPSKSAIVRAIADKSWQRILPVYQRLEKQNDPVEAIIQMIQFSVREYCGGSEARLCAEALAEASRNKLIRNLWLDCDREMRGMITRLLRRAVVEDRTPKDLDLESASIWILALVDGAVARFCLEPRTSLDKILITLDRMIRQFLTVGSLT